MAGNLGLPGCNVTWERDPGRDMMQSIHYELSTDGLLSKTSSRREDDQSARAAPNRWKCWFSLTPSAADWPGTTRLSRMVGAGVGK